MSNQQLSGSGESNLQAKTPNGELNAIDAQLRADQARADSQGLIARGIDSALSLIWHSDSDTQNALKALREKVVSAEQSGTTEPDCMAPQVQKAIDADKQSANDVSTRDGIADFAANVAVTATYFMRGRRGRLLASALNGVNDIHTADGASGMAVDAFFGVAKGYALSRTFERLGSSNMPLAVRGVATGVAMRLENGVLTAENYRDENTRSFDIGTGLQRTAVSAFDPLSMTIDGLTLVGGSYFTRIADSKLNGLLTKNPLATNLFIGTTSGLVNGASAEIGRENGNYDPTRIAERAFLGAAQNAMAAAIGLHADRGLTAVSERLTASHSEDVVPPALHTGDVASHENFAQPTAIANPEEGSIPLRLRAQPIETMGPRTDTDLVIVGNGIMGLSLADTIVKTGPLTFNGPAHTPNLIVISEHEIGLSGNSPFMTGMNTRAIDGSYQAFKDTIGPNYEAFLEAVRKGQISTRELAERVGTYQPSNSFYFAYEPNDPWINNDLKPLVEADSRNSHLTGEDAAAVQPFIKEAVRLKEEGSVDPGDLLRGIADQPHFRDNVKLVKGGVIGVNANDFGVTLTTSSGNQINAKMVVFATGAPPDFLGDFSNTYENWDGKTILAHAPDHGLGRDNYFDTRTIAFFKGKDKDTVLIGGDADGDVPASVLGQIFPHSVPIASIAQTLPVSLDQRPIFDRVPGFYDRVVFAGLLSGTGLVYSGVGRDVVPKLLTIGTPHPNPDLWGFNRFNNEHAHIDTKPKGA